MEADKERCAYAAGPNPDYKGPPRKRWHTMEIVAAVGTECGLVEDNEHGLLNIIIRRKGETWPHGMEPKAGGVNMIAQGHRVYCVRSDDYGPDATQLVRDSAFLPVGQCRVLEDGLVYRPTRTMLAILISAALSVGYCVGVAIYHLFH